VGTLGEGQEDIMSSGPTSSNGHILKEFDAKSIRGSIFRDTVARPFQKKELLNPPNGSELQLE
jgi:hypothetical protein